ncbi:MAG: C39 family peptidase [Bacteroidales bacterium]|nr:C39 family peptidase [Bacteroidales bacterium]
MYTKAIKSVLICSILVFAGCSSHSDKADCGNNSARTENKNAVLLKDFPTLQQTTDYTCGNAASLMVMKFFGDSSETESSLAEKMHTHTDSQTPGAKPGSAKQWTDYGTSVGEIYNYFLKNKNYRIVFSSYDNKNSLLTDTSAVGIQAVNNKKPEFADYGKAAKFFADNIRNGRPVMVCWNAWGGHWTVCIGYDDNRTADFFDDDVLTMADPYDTTDGIQDGYTKVPLVQFFYDWFCTMTPKPYQLQPYIVVEKR